MLADIYFSVPLQVSFPNGVTRSFESVHNTVDFLENECLCVMASVTNAREICRGALYRMRPVAIAREAFVAACLEAGLPVQGLAPAWHRSGPSSPPRMNA